MKVSFKKKIKKTKRGNLSALRYKTPYIYLDILVAVDKEDAESLKRKVRSKP